MESLMKVHVAELSPVQWPAYLPVPTLLLRLIMKGLPCSLRKSKVGTVEVWP